MTCAASSNLPIRLLDPRVRVHRLKNNSIEGPCGHARKAARVGLTAGRILRRAWAARRRAPQGRRAAETPQENRPITLAEAVITNQQEAALDLARRSGVSWRADNLEGIVQLGDWQLARRLARQRWLEAVARPAGLPPRTGPEVKVVTRPAVCKSLGRGVYELPPVLPRTLCASVADEVKQRVKEGKWKSLFTKIPTRDVPVNHLAAREDLYRAIDASCHLVTLCTGQEVTYNRRQACVTVYDSAAEDTCCVCLETLKLDACLRPCQHMMCSTCAQRVDKCPLCRKRVVKVDSAANFSGLPMHADGKPTSTSPTLLITLDGLGGWSYRNDQSGFQSYKLEPPVGGGMMVPGNIIHGDLEKCGTRLVLLALCRPIRESEKSSLIEKQRVAALQVFGRLDPNADAEAAARAARDAAAFLRAERWRGTARNAKSHIFAAAVGALTTLAVGWASA